MYQNLIEAMKAKKITAKQVATLLECRTATISDKINGVVERGFYFDEAKKIKTVFFAEFDYEYLFARDNEVCHDIKN